MWAGNSVTSCMHIAEEEHLDGQHQVTELEGKAQAKTSRDGTSLAYLPRVDRGRAVCGGVTDRSGTLLC